MKKFTIKTLREHKEQYGIKTPDFWRLSYTKKRHVKFTPLLLVHVQLVNDDVNVDSTVRAQTDKTRHELFSYLARNKLRNAIYARGEREISFLMVDQAEAAMFKLAMS